MACTGARAQFLPRNAATGKELPPEERATLDGLEQLSHLPEGTWHYHTGDVAHGEDPSLDDSSWPAAKPNSEYPEEAL